MCAGAWNKFSAPEKGGATSAFSSPSRLTIGKLLMKRAGWRYLSLCCLSVCVCCARGRVTSGDKIFSPKKSSLFSAFVPCRGSEKYLQGGIEEIMGAVKEKCGGVIDEVIVVCLVGGCCRVIVRRMLRWERWCGVVRVMVVVFLKEKGFHQLQPNFLHHGDGAFWINDSSVLDLLNLFQALSCVCEFFFRVVSFAEIFF